MSQDINNAPPLNIYTTQALYRVKAAILILALWGLVYASCVLDYNLTEPNLKLSEQAIDNFGYATIGVCSVVVLLTGASFFVKQMDKGLGFTDAMYPIEKLKKRGQSPFKGVQSTGIKVCLAAEALSGC